MAEQGLKLETIQRALAEGESHGILLAGAKACKLWGKGPKTKEDWQMVEQWAQDDRWWYRAAALYAYGPGRAPMQFLKEGLFDCYREVVEAAIYAAQGKSLDEGLINSAYYWFNLKNLGDLPEKMIISKEKIMELLSSNYWNNRYLAVKACTNRDVPLKWLFDILETESFPEIIDAAVQVLRSKNISRRTLKQQWSKFQNYESARVLAGRDDMADIIRDNIDGHELLVCASVACEGVHFPLEDIGRWMRSECARVRLAAAYACVDRPDVPDEWVKQLMDDGSYKVRLVARRARKGRNIPPVREFEPPELVYKRCLNDVIVTAKIPADAEIRGYANGKARTDKAIIVDVDGDFFGEKVGIAKYDHETLYRVGDDVNIPDFNPNDEECGTGFHFFSSTGSAGALLRIASCTDD